MNRHLFIISLFIVLQLSACTRILSSYYYSEYGNMIPEEFGIDENQVLLFLLETENSYNGYNEYNRNVRKIFAKKYKGKILFITAFDMEFTDLDKYRYLIKSEKESTYDFEENDYIYLFGYVLIDRKWGDFHRPKFKSNLYKQSLIEFVNNLEKKRVRSLYLK